MSSKIEVFQAMLEDNPDNAMVLFGLANEHLKIENYSEAIETLEKYLKFETDEGAAYGMLAKAYESKNNPEKANEAYKKGIEVSLTNGHPSMAEDYRMTLEMNYE